VLLRKPVSVSGAGRTDTGVHARGQVIAFDADTDKTPQALLKGFNGLMPQSIRGKSAEEVPEVFDPRRDAQHKTYRYTWYNHPYTSPFWRHHTWHAHEPLDIEAMQKAAHVLVGEHDFSSFRAAGCTAKTPVRRILACEIVKDAERVQMRIRGEAFLHQMVRIIAGTLFDIGTGKRPWTDMKAVLAGKNRKLAGKTAPPEGLTLWEVSYGAIPRPGRKVLKKH
jgi:tRNA pseudouridine38-40 synthase